MTTEKAKAVPPSGMMFVKALKRVLVHEGGKVNHPKDPGGKTNKGITQRVYNAWLGKSDLPPKDVYGITDDEVEAIYRFQYWNAIKGDYLPDGLGYVVFDGAVNSGSKQSVKWLQRSLGFPPEQVDGVLGTMTLDAINSVNDYDALISKILDRREIFLRALKTFKTFGTGWMRRLASVEEAGQAWASGSVEPSPKFIEGANAKASIDDAKKAPPKAPGDITATGGVVTGTAGELVRQAQEQLAPYASLAWVKPILVGIVIIGVIVAAGGLVWRWYATTQANKLTDALDTKV